ncbi:MAG: Trk system potassium transporter TrkA [Clostridiales bacterium]|nr:Trk system potassium transporter TrkA [Clostridiales bacterium]
MNIIVVGCGKIGTTLVASLVSEGHDVIAIDNDPDVISEITNIYDVMAICGNGTDSVVLDEADIEKAEMFIAVTGSDELNLLSCFIAGKMGAAHTIARIRNPEYNEKSLGFVRQQLGLSMAINPEMLTAKELFNILKFPSAVKIETFSRRNIEMVEIRIKDGSPLDGMKLCDLRIKYKSTVLVCVVQRKDQIYIPDGNFVLKSGDKIGLTATPAEIQKFLKALGVLEKQARSIMILGGSRTAYYLSKMLSTIGNSVKIIEQDSQRCLELSDALPKAVVIHGDGAKQELLNEEGINSVDAFVALTGMDEENILISVFASMQNVPKVVSKINRDELAALAEKMGLDCIVSPRQITADIIVQYARALQNSMGSSVETLYKLMDGRVEALEFNVRSYTKFTGKPLKDLKFKSNVIIAGIVRKNKIIIPFGDDVILEGDRVVVIAKEQRLNDLSDIQ